MNHDDLKDLFTQADQTEADASTKAKHLQQAREAFLALHNLEAQSGKTQTGKARVSETQTSETQPSETQPSETQPSETRPAIKKLSFFQGILKHLRLTENKAKSGSIDARNTFMSYLHLPKNPQVFYPALGASLVLVLGIVFILGPTEHSTLGKPEIQQRELAAAQPEEAQVLAEELIVADAIAPMTNKAEAYAATESYAETIQTAPAIASPTSKKRLIYNRSAVSDTIAPPPPLNGDSFEDFAESGTQLVSQTPVSTFSVDVDTASYSFVRRQLNGGTLPPKDAVRTEEMINYFDYQYPLPADQQVPFSTSVTVVDAPWNTRNKVVHIGIKGYEMTTTNTPRSNLVLLLDVSGSMTAADKLPLVKQSMQLLLNQLHPEDTVAIVVYAGAAGTVLEPTPAKHKQKILDAMNRLEAGGSTAGAAGIQLAYQLAENAFVEEGVNRILLATDGDFNVGIDDREQLQDFVERKREKGIFLSVLGFGQGNYNDHLMQTLAQNGNGVATYIDTLSEAQKVLVHEANASLFTIAKDVKIQVEFNPHTVNEYRLIGYETRALKQEDFNNDNVDAGDIGSGHTVTAIYEITPTGEDNGLIDASRYSHSIQNKSENMNEYGYLKLRYKLPKESVSQKIETPIAINGPSQSPIQEVRFSMAVAGFAQLLKGGRYTGQWTYSEAIELAQANKGDDEFGYRTEFVQLIRKAQMASEM